ncbi:MAG: tRNA pseudouridine(38-40) synthase TruA [Gemmatimonadota bacterium]|nr:tRNA pseudouridine(38-40) synthase TruA [Gemmatimonadota bacterium]
MDAPESIRLSLTVQYDGAAFHGWQVQPDQRTVQGVLEDVLSRLGNRPCTVLGSGRTDTGVHATGQVAAVDMPPTWTPASLHRSLTAVLPPDLWVESVRAVPPDFHPRYDALARTYEYRIGSTPEAASPFYSRWCWALSEPVDGGLLDASAALLPGTHSFLAFAKAGQPERGDMCTVREAKWSEWSHGTRMTITADRYLHHMVRYLVGTMVDIGRGRRPLTELPRLLENDPELTTSPPAPPQGLFLSRVEYPDSVRPSQDVTHKPTRSTATA